MNATISRLVAAVVLSPISFGVHADVDDARAKGLKWLVQNQKGDGSFAGLGGLEIQSTAAAVQAMLLGGLSKSPQNARALGWLANGPQGSLDAQAALIGALAAAGRDASGPASVVRDARNTVAYQSGTAQGSIATWGSYPGYAASVVDTAFGYGALRVSGATYANDAYDRVLTALCVIVPAQLTASPWAGAWPHSLPQTGQPALVSSGSLISTSVMLLELKKQRMAARFLSGSVCGRTSPAAIDTAIANAKTWLMAQANSDGGFAERDLQTALLERSNPVVTALALQALAPFALEGDALAATRVSNGRTWLLTQQNADGSWRGDPFVTAQALAALPAATGTQVADLDGDGLTDVVEHQLGTQVAASDSQGTLATSAGAVTGITATSFSASGVIGQAFSYSLAGSGMSGSATYAKTAGALPPGLSLTPAGVITGTPTQVGSFSFDYSLNDGTGDTAVVIGRIDIAATNAAGDDPADSQTPLPAWALALLGGALLTVARRKRSS